MRVVIPNELRKAVLAELHMAHPGVVRMKEVARSHVWWLDTDSGIESTVRRCAPCQANVPQPSVAPLTPWMWPGKPWYRVHMDCSVMNISSQALNLPSQRREAHSCCTVSPGKQRRGGAYGANIQAQFAGVRWHRISSSRATRRFSAKASNNPTFRDRNIAGKPDVAA